MAGMFDWLMPQDQQAGGLLGPSDQMQPPRGPNMALMGFGMGMLSPDARGNGWGNAMQGFMSGAQHDQQGWQMRKKLADERAQREAFANIKPDPATGQYDMGALGSALGRAGLPQIGAEAIFKAAPQYEYSTLPNGEIVRTNKKTGETSVVYQGKLKPTDDIQEYKMAVEQGFTGKLEDWMARKRAGAGEYGLQPIWGTDANGQPAAAQLGKTGSAIQSKMPDGFNISKEPIKLDAGTHHVLLDPITRQTIGIIPKNIAQAAAEGKVGAAAGAAQAELPGAWLGARQTTEKIDQLLEHKGLPDIVGIFDQYRPSWTLSNDGRDALARYEQLQGGAFMEAYKTLKGGGQITEVEGVKAERALVRMNRAQDEKAFKLALMDFRDAVRDGLKKMEAQARMAPRPANVTTDYMYDPSTGGLK